MEIKIKLKWSDFAYKSPNSGKIIFDLTKTVETLGKLTKLTGLNFNIEQDLRGN